MISRPRFKPDRHVEVVGDHVFLLGEGRNAVLSGAAAGAIARAIDGDRTTDEIVDGLMSAHRPTDLYRAILELEKQGHIEEVPVELPAVLGQGQQAYWTALGSDATTAARQLTAQTVSVDVLGAVDPASIGAAVEALGISRSRSSDQAALRLVAVEDALDPRLEDINEDALRTGRPWLLLRPSGLFPWVGPLFEPRVTGCWRCLAQRLAANQEVETFLAGLPADDRRLSGYPPLAALPSLAQATIGLAATEAAKWLVLHASSLSGRIITLDSISLQTQEHVLVRRPQCSACGDPASFSDADPEVRLQSRPKVYQDDGGHRASTPGSMLRRYRHHVSPITGVAKSLVRITDPDDTVQHVYLAGSNIAVRHDSYDRLRRNLRSFCCGKGTTDEQAQASGLGEAIERYSGVFRGEEPRTRGSFHSLGDRAIDPRACMLYSDRQYRERDQWNALGRQLDSIPLPFDETAELEWSPLWSLTRQEPRYLPTGQCYYSYPGSPEQAYFLPDSNGSAAGTSLEDAVLQGFMELVERDSVALWWYNRVRRPAVDLDRVDDPFVQQMRRLHAGLGRQLWVLDLTTDLGIPALVAISRLVDPPAGTGEEIVFAPAAHFDPRLCLRRALSELNQMMPGLAPAADGSGYAYDDPEAVRWWSTATLADQPYLAPSDDPATDLGAIERAWSDDLLTDIETCRSIVEARGLEMLVLDQTRPDIGLPVAKVVVPGLRHFWARYAPGRLYDVPVELGWLDRPTDEADLNPITMFI